VSKMRIAVLMGGTSGERAISLSTGRQIMAALDPSKYAPVAVDTAALTSFPSSPEAGSVRTASAPMVEAKAAAPPATEPTQSHQEPAGLDLQRWTSDAERGTRPDVAFIALHGRGGEDGAIQGLLDLLGIPYTGSGVLASALAMDKAMTKRLLRADGIPVPDDLLVGAGDLGRDAVLTAKVQERLRYPVVVKPNREGSTLGCSIARTPGELAPAIADALRFDPDVLVEAYLAGTEITAGLLGNRDPDILPLVEIVARGGFYDYEAKYAPGGSEHIIPARISDSAAALAREYAARTHCLLGCRGMSRVDMIVVGDQPYVLEINTIPGMTPTSLLPDAARAAGIGFSALLDRIIGYAVADSGTQG